jgi:hypothetical protein
MKKEFRKLLWMIFFDLAFFIPGEQAIAKLGVNDDNSLQNTTDEQGKANSDPYENFPFRDVEAVAQPYQQQQQYLYQQQQYNSYQQPFYQQQQYNSYQQPFYQQQQYNSYQQPFYQQQQYNSYQQQQQYLYQQYLYQQLAYQENYNQYIDAAAANFDRTFISFSDTHGIYENYQNMKNFIDRLSKNKGIDILFNGDFFDRFETINDNYNIISAKYISSAYANDNTKPDNFCKYFGDSKNTTVINMGAHELLSGKEPWINFLKNFNDTKGDNKIYILNSNLISGISDKNCANGLEPYVISDNVGYIGWNTLNVLTNSGAVNNLIYKTKSSAYPDWHWPQDWFKEEWINDGIKLDSMIFNDGKINPEDVKDNCILNEFIRNMKECIKKLLENANQRTIYLNIAAQAEWKEITPIIEIVFLRLQEEYQKIFSKLVINIIISNNHEEEFKTSQSTPQTPYNIKLNDKPPINLLAPGPFGNHGIVGFLNNQFYLLSTVTLNNRTFR